MTEHLPNWKIIRTSPETQGFSSWEPPSGTLGELTRTALVRATDLASRAAGLERAAMGRRPAPSLEAALQRDFVAIIAEVKRSSPSRGRINAALRAGPQARAYEAGGAAAISVLTEPHRFSGHESDLVEVVASSGLPVLKKDFHVAEIQLVEAKALGASAALLIVRALSPRRLSDMARTARDIGLEILFEVRDEAELERALDAGATMIGVNNRNLETLEVDASTVPRMVPLVPRHVIAVAESGYATPDNVQTAATAGADAVLVGSALSSSADPGEAVRGLRAIPRAGGRRPVGERTGAIPSRPPPGLAGPDNR